MIVLLLLVPIALAGAGEGRWERVAERDGIVIERRTDDPSPVRELRAKTHSPLPPAAIMATLWRHEDYVQFVPYLRRLDVLRDDGDVKLVYEQIHVPFLKDRDATVRFTRTVAATSGVYEMTSRAVPEEGPPERDGFVRVRTSQARWSLAPADDGGTAVTYTLRTDMGGLVPAWIVNAAQKDAVARLIRAMLDRARDTARPH